MGIRFACHHCNHALHVKDFQAGKRGRCPACQGPFRIPRQSALVSLAIDESVDLTASDNQESESRSENVGTLTATRKKRSSSHGSLDNKRTNAVEPTQDNTNSHVLKKREDESAPAVAASELLSRDLNHRDLTQRDMPEVFAKVQDARWYVRPPSGGQYGPAPSRLVMDWIAERRVTGDSLIWCDGMAQWQLAQTLVPSLFAPGPVSVAPVAATTPPVAEPAQPLESLAPRLSESQDVDAIHSLLVDDSPLNKKLELGEVPNQATAMMLKRRRERRRQWTVIVLLGLVSVALLATLIIVLVIQMQKK